MQTRKIGSDSIPSIGVGTMSFVSRYDPSDDTESLAVMERAIDLGNTHIDTAEAYGDGHSEILVGKAIAGRRDKVFLATKFGSGGPSGDLDGRGTPDLARKSLEGSLKRLHVDYVDLYYLHRVDPVTPIEETVGEMAKFVKEGKVRYLGLSEASTQTIRRAHAIHPIHALQSEYSMFTRDPEQGTLDCTRELGITFVSYSPLGRGMLTGGLVQNQTFGKSDTRQILPRFLGENLTQNLTIVQKLLPVAKELAISPAQLSLAWVLAQGNDIVAIPGTRSIDRLEENLAAATIDLSKDALTIIENILEENPVSGERYDQQRMDQIDH